MNINHPKSGPSSEFDVAVQVIDGKERLRQTLRVSSLEHTFDNFKILAGTEEAFNSFEAFAEGKGPPLLLCYGGVGNGKTYLLEATAIRLRVRGVFCRCYAWPEIMGTFKSHLGHGSVPPYDDLFWRFCRASVLLVDDVGMGGSGSEWEFGVLEELINYRYRERLMTALVTNKELDQLPERVVSRCRDLDIGKIVWNAGKDYRRYHGAEG